MTRSLAACILAGLTALAAAPTRAAAEDQVAEPDLTVHASLTIGLGAMYFLGELAFKDPLSRDTCRWCGPIGFDDGVRDGLRWDDKGLARVLSHATGYAGASVWALGGIGLAAHLDGRGSASWLGDGVIIAEAAAITGVLNAVVKSAVARERPFVHALAPEDKPDTEHPQENNLSFYSGHSALSMSLAVSAGTVASMRGDRWAPLLYGGGIAISLSAGYLRIAADKHWASDVLTGWVMGAAMGYAVPRLLHRKGAGVTPVLTGSTAGVAFTW